MRDDIANAAKCAIERQGQLAWTSPPHHAARIAQPLRLAYGGADMRVPHYYGDRFYKAVKSGNKDVKLIVYEQEGHGSAASPKQYRFLDARRKIPWKHIAP